MLQREIQLAFQFQNVLKPEMARLRVCGRAAACDLTRSPGVGSVISSGSMTRYYWAEEIRIQLRCYIILLQTTAGKVPTRWRLGPGKIGDSNIYLEPISFLSHSRREQRIGGGNLVLTAMIYLQHRNPASSAPILTGIVLAAGDKEEGGRTVIVSLLTSDSAEVQGQEVAPVSGTFVAPIRGGAVIRA